MSRATNSFDHIRVTAEDADAHQKSDTLRASITNIIEVLAEALEGTIAQDEVERAITALQMDNPPTLVLNEVEVAMCDLIRTVVLAGNATLKNEMTTIIPKAIGELPEALVDPVRACLDHIMIATEQRTHDALVHLQQALQEQCKLPNDEHIANVNSLRETISNFEQAIKGTVSKPPAAATSISRETEEADRKMVASMAVLTEKTYIIQTCRDTIRKLETAKKSVSALNKAARRALEKDPSRDLPDIEEEQKMQQNIDAEMKDLTNAERERSSFASQCFNVQMVLKVSYKINIDALKALNKLVGSKLSAHWDAEKATEVKTLQSRFIIDNICMLYALVLYPSNPS